ncbi:MAG: prepilin-type N-terminal cleavage/methylation domain-containing protein [Chitinispirillaceae bacterium]|nr:prepilin-type N-terminal cleavage/methylation domain-containing protein [Chitinispirillaceae bacterium]
MFHNRQKNEKGFTLVEVIVVAVIVAVLALVGIQLYQGYATEARRNTAENLAASAASFLQTIVNATDAATADALAPHPTIDGDLPNPADNSWQYTFPGGAPPVIFTCPANATVTKDLGTGLVTATVGGVNSLGTYKYKVVAAGP